MGKSLSSDSSYGRVAVRLERPQFAAGEQVNGVVQLDLVKPFPARVLNLIVLGKEKVRIVEKVEHHRSSNKAAAPKNGGHHSDHKVVHRDSEEFYKHSFALFDCGADSFPPGQYSFPFSFRLGEHLPGSFRHCFTEHGEKCYGKIKYRVLAGLRGTGRLAPSLFDKAPLQVHQRLEPSAGPAARLYSQDVQLYCCRSAGRFQMKCGFSGDRFVLGGQVSVVVEADGSACRVDASAVKCSLVRTVSLRVRGGSFARTIPFLASSVSAPGLKAGEKRAGTEAIALSLAISAETASQATSHGSMVSNTYKLVVDVSIDACLGYNPAPSNEIDIKVFEPPGPPAELAPLAENWRPKVLPPFVCPLTGDFRLSDEAMKDLALAGDDTASSL